MHAQHRVAWLQRMHHVEAFYSLADDGEQMVALMKRGLAEVELRAYRVGPPEPRHGQGAVVVPVRGVVGKLPAHKVARSAHAHGAPAVLGDFEDLAARERARHGVAAVDALPGRPPVELEPVVEPGACELHEVPHVDGGHTAGQSHPYQAPLGGEDRDLAAIGHIARRMALDGRRHGLLL